MPSIAVFSPAKINLFLAVTGRRPDGFHDLVSLVAPLDWGDSLWLRSDPVAGPVTLTCDDPAVPAGAENLAVRAAETWRAAAGFRSAVQIALRKRIPMGAGLGGGSSNAVAVLRGLNALHGHPLPPSELARLAAALGSDCPLFLADGPCVMRGRGERLAPLPADARAQLSGRRILLFKPDFGISTPWAYGRLVSAGGDAYLPADSAEARLDSWLAGRMPLGGLLFNSFESVAFAKFQALPLALDTLRAQPGVEGVLMSGSGSASFALLAADADVERLRAMIVERLGPATLIVSATIR